MTVIPRIGSSNHLRKYGLAVFAGICILTLGGGGFLTDSRFNRNLMAQKFAAGEPISSAGNPTARNSKEQQGTAGNNKEQQGTERNNKEQQGTARNSNEQQRTARNNKEQQGTARNNKEQQGTAGNNKEQQGTTRNSEEQRGKARNSREQQGTMRNSKEQEGTIRNNKEQQGTERNSKEEMIERSRKKSSTVLVHYVRFYETDPATPNSNSSYLQLCYLECLGVLSVMVHIKDVQIHIHSNFPRYIPYDSCRNLTGNWSAIQMVDRARITQVGGKSVQFIHHSADMAKLEVLYEYGGIVMDFDVYVLKGEKRLQTLFARYECVISQEFPTMMNAGFSACRRGSTWPLDLLQAYRTDFRPQDWLYNSGTVPFRQYSENAKYRRSVFVDQTIANNPNGKAKYLMQARNNVIDWKAKLGYHSFIDDCAFDRTAANATKSSFGYLLRYILAKSLKPEFSSQLDAAKESGILLP
ncbi:hypothetical protein BV898_07304 [Hypsibius exemplaris]|uniref:Uncharacterized protein n=1 Tax=Hypsibius exemplaris TaxID=2072580 RepID=A0A1W0WTZ4_HYPEX|nr:hypothetical protein BV898_07304 [Hypsibius exemplaris]